MKLSFKFLSSVVLSCLTIESAARAVGGKPKRWIQPYKRAPLQDVVCDFYDLNRYLADIT